MATDPPTPRIVKEMASVALTREQFAERFRAAYADPAFGSVGAELEAVLETAWQAYSAHRKSPRTRRAGEGYADPTLRAVGRLARGA